MEELFNELNIKFTAYNWHKSFLRPNNEKDIAGEIKQEIIEILSQPLDCRVINFLAKGAKNDERLQ